MSTLVISNRVPKLGEVAAGGLAVLLADALGSGDVWLGWNGQRRMGRPEPTKTVFNEKGVAYASFPYRKGPADRFYADEPKKGEPSSENSDLSNGVHWQIHHGMKADAVTSGMRYASNIIQEEMAQRGLEQVKQSEKAGRPFDAVWVHDYHFMDVGRRMKESGLGMPVGFFLHIPFPKAEERAQLSTADRKRFYGGLVEYDLIGFQTDKDRREFANFAVEELGAKRGRDNTLVVEGHTAKLGVYPAGIDPKFFENRSYTHSSMVEEDNSPEARKKKNPGIASILKRAAGRKLLVSVERMDPSKGILQRFKAFLNRIKTNPRAAKEEMMVQIGTVTRQGVESYREYRKDVHAVAAGQRQIDILEETFTRGQLVHLFHHAKIGLVTSMADGMNLVAKEFVAAQDPRDPAPLIISIHAGAAEKLVPAGAIPCDPKVPGSIEAAIDKAMNMSQADRIKAHKAMMDVITTDTAAAWGQRFLQDLTGKNDNVIQLKAVAGGRPQPNPQNRR